jgi:hypothetical protein
MRSHELALGLALVAATTGCGSDAPAAPSHPDDLEVADLGMHALDHDVTVAQRMVRETADIAIPIAEDSLSTTIFVRAPIAEPSTEHLLAVSRLSAPDGALWIDATTAPGNLDAYTATLTGAVRPSSNEGFLTFELSASDRVAAPAGTYELRVAAGKAVAEVQVFAIRRPGPVLARGLLDLNLFFVPGSGWSSTDSRLDSLLDRFFATFAQANIARGDVTRTDLTGADLAPLANPASTSDFFRLFAHSPDGTRAMNVFFVAGLGSKGLLGVSKTAPMQVGVPGSPTGIALAAQEAEPHGLPVLAQVMAHEAAHGLGLLHTTDLTSHDLISDTEPAPVSWTPEM